MRQPVSPLRWLLVVARLAGTLAIIQPGSRHSPEALLWPLYIFGFRHWLGTQRQDGGPEARHHAALHQLDRHRAGNRWACAVLLAAGE